MNFWLRLREFFYIRNKTQQTVHHHAHYTYTQEIICFVSGLPLFEESEFTADVGDNEGLDLSFQVKGVATWNDSASLTAFPFFKPSIPLVKA